MKHFFTIFIALGLLVFEGCTSQRTALDKKISLLEKLVIDDDSLSTNKTPAGMRRISEKIYDTILKEGNILHITHSYDLLYTGNSSFWARGSILPVKHEVAVHGNMLYQRSLFNGRYYFDSCKKPSTSNSWSLSSFEVKGIYIDSDYKVHFLIDPPMMAVINDIIYDPSTCEEIMKKKRPSN